MSLAASLGRLVRPPGRTRARGERCELCGAALADPHPHVVDVRERALRCACGACAVLFRQRGAGGDRFRTVPDRVLRDPGFALSEAEWSALQIPVQLAFLFRSTAAGRWIAVYPGPAGVVESSLPLDAWERISGRSPLVAAAEPDVEALLVRGETRPDVEGSPPAGAAGLEVLLVPIDRCYELAGRVRRAWRGFQGGAGVRREIDAFFEELRGRARPVRSAREGGR